MPSPASSTLMKTKPSSRAGPHRNSMQPSCGEACAAFSSRFQSTCLISAGSMHAFASAISLSSRTEAVRGSEENICNHFAEQFGQRTQTRSGSEGLANARNR